VEDRVTGLTEGADDYMVKPFSMVELLARIEAVRRRAGLQAGAAAGRRRTEPRPEHPPRFPWSCSISI